MPLDILYEDQEIIVCYKPSGTPTQTKRFGQQDMESLIKNYRAKKKEEPFVGIVHRLDQPVEGVMVFAKTKNAAAELSRQVRERTISKKYFAAVAMKPELISQSTFVAKGTLTDYIAFDQKKNVAWIVPAEKEAEIKKADAKKAVLDYEFIENDGSSQAKGVLVDNAADTTVRAVDVTLHTGRHHQIRLQLSNQGWPIVGDTKYGTSLQEAESGRTQLGLCSYHIAFSHPKTKKEMEFSIHPKNPLFQGLLP